MKKVKVIRKIKPKVKIISFERSSDKGDSDKRTVKPGVEKFVNVTDERLSKINLGTGGSVRVTKQRIENDVVNLGNSRKTESNSSRGGYSEFSSGGVHTGVRSNYRLGESLGINEIRASPTRQISRAGIPSSDQNPFSSRGISRKGIDSGSRDNYDAKIKKARKKTGPWN